MTSTTPPSPSPPPAPATTVPMAPLPTPVEDGPLPLPALTPPPLSTQTVVVNVPPDATWHVDHPDTGAFTPALATLIAAIFALIAAGIAYRGVMKTIRSASNQGQLDRDAEAARQRRGEHNALLTQAIRNMQIMADIYGTALWDDEAADQKFQTARQECRISAEMLRVTGLTESANKLDSFVGGIADMWENSRASAPPGQLKIPDVVNAFHAELSARDLGSACQPKDQ